MSITAAVKKKERVARPLIEDAVAKAIAVGGFDKVPLPLAPKEVPVSNDELVDKANRLRELYGRSVASQMEAGKILYEVSETMPAPEFENWWTGEVKWSRSQVYRLMALFRCFGHYPIELVSQFSLTALYGICGDNDRAKTQRNLLLEKAKAGQFIDWDAVRKLNIDRYGKVVPKGEKPDKPEKGEWTRHTYAGIKITASKCDDPHDLLRALRQWIERVEKVIADVRKEVQK